MSKLSHIDDTGAARMVDVGDKASSRRIASAEASVVMLEATADLIRANALKKGDVLATARIAGVMAAKKTADIIPLCHPLPIIGITVDFSWQSDKRLIIHSTVKVDGKTGVEMEALTAVSVAALTVYDMAKAVDKAMEIKDIKLAFKDGGKSGRFDRTPSQKDNME